MVLKHAVGRASWRLELSYFPGLYILTAPIEKRQRNLHTELDFSRPFQTHDFSKAAKIASSVVTPAIVLPNAAIKIVATIAIKQATLGRVASQ